MAKDGAETSQPCACKNTKVQEGSGTQSLISPSPVGCCRTGSNQSCYCKANLDFLLGLSEDQVWSLRKGDLRHHFTTLQKITRVLASNNQLPQAEEWKSCSSTLKAFHINASPSGGPHQSPLLRLPPEIRAQILLRLLNPPANPPHRGPHPRQLQSHLSLTQSFPPAILSTCKQLYIESMAIFYGSAKQTVHVTVDWDIWAHKRSRSPLSVSSHLRSSIRQVHVHVFLGAEKRNTRPEKPDADARLEVVRKGVRKLGKWLSVANQQILRISWQEPPQTYTWDQKRFVLDEFRAMSAIVVEPGEINWGLRYPGRRFRLDEDYIKTLARKPET
jgi:hypothetical protein